MSQLFQNLLWKPEFPPTPVLDEDFNAFNITRFEDTFNRTDPAPWEPVAASTVDPSKVSLSIVGGKARMENTDNAGFDSFAVVTMTTIVGAWYKAVCTDLAVVAGTTNLWLEARDGIGNSGNLLGASDIVSSGPMDAEFYFQAVGTTTYIDVRDGAGTIGTVSEWDNVFVEEVPALSGLTAVNVTPSVTDGVLRLENTTAAAGYAYYTAPTTASSVYDFEWTDPESDPDSAVSIGTTAGGIDLQAITTTKQFQFTATTATSFVNLWVNSAVLGEDAYFGSFSVTEDTGVTESGVVGFGGVKFKENSVSAPQFVDRGLPFDDTYILAVDAVNAVDYVYQGLPFTVLGRIAADLVGPVDRVAPGNIPLSAAGRLVFSAGPVAVAVAGVNYAADESVVGIPS